MTAEKTLLAVIEQGGYPDFSSLYQAAGFQVIKVSSTRKALGQIKRQPPSLVVAEFLYSPTYGTRISNFEALAAGLACSAPAARLLALVDRDKLDHLEKIRKLLPPHEVLTFPISEAALQRSLEKLAHD